MSESAQPDADLPQVSASIQKARHIEDKVKEAIAAINNEGRYQKIALVVLSCQFVVAAYFLVGTGYLFMNPSFSCNGEKTSQVEACKILEDNVNVSPAIFGKVIIICDIIANKYDQAKLGLLLLKEQNKPGDSFFIDLAYSLMSENSQEDSESIKKKLVK